jgi:hypothetical protein
LGNTLLIFKNTNLVAVWISHAVSVIFERDKFSRYVGVITGFSDAKMVVKFYEIYSGRPALRRALIYLFNSS